MGLGALLLTGAFAQTAPKQSKLEAFDQAKSWEHLIKQVEFGPRVPNTDGHKKCGDYILDEMRKYCENVREQPIDYNWSQRGLVHMRNLIGEQNWKNSSVRVLLIAHWDSRPNAPQEMDPTDKGKPIPGANDGASGVAVLLELMRVLKQTPANVGVMYLMTDGEDLGPGLDEMFLGAKYFAQHLPDPQPTYGILLDMIGDKDLSIPMEIRSNGLAPDLMKAFYQHAKKVGLAGTFPSVKGDDILDDHLALNDAGVPTIDLIDFDFPAWHTLADTPDKCAPESLGKVGKQLQTWLQLDKPWRPGMTYEDTLALDLKPAVKKPAVKKPAAKKPASKKSTRRVAKRPS